MKDNNTKRLRGEQRKEEKAKVMTQCLIDRNLYNETIDILLFSHTCEE